MAPLPVQGEQLYTAQTTAAQRLRALSCRRMAAAYERHDKPAKGVAYGSNVWRRDETIAS